MFFCFAHARVDSCSKYESVISKSDSSEIMLSALNSSASIPKMIITEPDHAEPEQRTKKPKTNRRPKKVSPVSNEIEESEPKVKIEIRDNGTIEVISDKETTV